MTSPTATIEVHPRLNDEQFNVQGADGTAHFAYFDKRTQASFIWDGRTDYINVDIGGYGEPTDHRIFVSRLSLQDGFALTLLTDFARVCQRHADTLPDY